MSLPKISHTQVSNAFIDFEMKRVSGNSTKAFLMISRKTIGWHKEVDRIALSQIIKFCGFTRNTARKAIEELLSLNLVIMERTGKGKGIKTTFEINYDAIGQNLTHTENANGSNSPPIDESNGSEIDPLNPPNGANSPPTKESLLKKEYKETKGKRRALPELSDMDLEVVKAVMKMVRHFGAIEREAREGDKTYFSVVYFVSRADYTRESWTDTIKLMTEWLTFQNESKIPTWPLDEKGRAKWVVKEIEYAAELMKAFGYASVKAGLLKILKHHFWKNSFSSLGQFNKALIQTEAQSGK
jgi:phage replication O-like protein O